MIDYVSGRLERVEPDSATLAVGPAGLQVLISPWTCQQLQPRLGQDVKLYTVSYLQGFGMNTFQPVLVGFESEQDRGFFQLMTTVDRLGPRAVLRALTKPVNQIAAAIEAGDVAFLKQLPGIGRQTSAQIIAKLQGKVAGYAVGAGPATAVTTAAAPVSSHPAAADVLEVLAQLGYSAAESERMLAEALQHGDGDAETLIRRIFVANGGGPGR